MITYFFAGWKTLQIGADDTACALDICRAYCLAYDQFTPSLDGGIVFRMKNATAKVFLALSREENISVQVTGEGGMPLLLKKISRRWGLCVGLLLSAVLLALSTTVVWDVRVSGNQTISDQGIKDALEQCGFCVGTSLVGFRADKVQNQVLIQDKRLAWISINMKGTVAYVEVREAVYPPVEDTDTPTNLVASIGGQILHVELTRGNVLVTAGQWVGEGDLLVSGVYDSEQVGVRYTHAKAQVYARTMRQITVEIPLLHQERQYATPDEAILGEKCLIFFGKRIKFSNKTRNMGEFCDTIERVEVPFSKWGVGFPIAWQQTFYLPYTVVEATYTHAEAEELAYLELARRISEIPGAEILSKTITTTRTPTSLVLQCSLVCMENIAKEQAFEVEW